MEQLSKRQLILLAASADLMSTVRAKPKAAKVAERLVFAARERNDIGLRGVMVVSKDACAGEDHGQEAILREMAATPFDHRDWEQIELGFGIVPLALNGFIDRFQLEQTLHVLGWFLDQDLSDRALTMLGNRVLAGDGPWDHPRSDYCERFDEMADGVMVWTAEGESYFFDYSCVD